MLLPEWRRRENRKGYLEVKDITKIIQEVI
jgi:hypothetical protein